MVTQRKGSVGPPARSALPPGRADIETAIMATMVYADIFDYPLTAQEVYRYLIEMAASRESVQATLNDGRLLPNRLARRRGFYTLPGRESIVDTRLRRGQVAAGMWPRAMHYGRMIANMPFVRMVAVTGALAMDNVEPGDDIDFLIVTKPGRLWLSRAIIIGRVVKPAEKRGYVICPNYFLSERALLFRERNLFTAHELSQMVPVAGIVTYHRMRQLNSWTGRFLPNSSHPQQREGTDTSSRRPVQALAEYALRTPIGAWLERWEMNRKVRRLSLEADGPAGIAFSADWCKGHFDDHEQLILQAFSKRMNEIAA